MLFSVEREKVNIARFLPLAALFILVLFFMFFSGHMKESNHLRNKDILERALTRSITQCYALEGTYPPNLDYLVDNYGLTYDSDSYYIDYTYIGSNLRPDYIVIERQNPKDHK